MEEVVKQFKPSVLLGLAAQPAGLFTREMIESMRSYCARPIVMPMSNPTAKAECTPAQAYEWSAGTAIVATGSPFPPYTQGDGKVLIPSQCNNMYVFPGLGLAASVAGVSEITDAMLYKAAVACVDTMTAEEIGSGRTFPQLKRIREVSRKVACAVIDEALTRGLATKISREEVPTAEDLEALVHRKMYDPVYVPLIDNRRQ